MNFLKKLLCENEIIIEYHITSENFITRNCISEIGNTDISVALENTLHRILEGGNEKDVYEIMGAEVPTDEQLEELEETGEYIEIDMGYIIPGLIDSWNELRERLDQVNLV